MTQVCVIFGAGEYYAGTPVVPAGAYVIAADGGLDHTRQLGIVPDVVVGDFDSLEGRPPRIPLTVQSWMRCLKRRFAYQHQPANLAGQRTRNIGRRHTAQQTVDAFHLAREAGFTNINMDLIVGLPGDTYETFCDTIEKVIALDPENVTVHALALKRSSFITQSGEINKAHADAALADRMMAYAESG